MQPLPLLPTKLRRVLVWFRRDLRVADNPALVAALQMAEEVVRGQGARAGLGSWLLVPAACGHLAADHSA